MSAAKPVKAAGLNFAGATGLNAPPVDQPERPPAASDAKPVRRRARRQLRPDPEFDVPERVNRRAARLKVDFYLDAQLAQEADDLVSYAAFRFRLKRGEVQDVVVAVGMDNRAEIIRQLHERAYGDGDE